MNGGGRGRDVARQWRDATVASPQAVFVETILYQSWGEGYLWQPDNLQRFPRGEA